MRHHYRLALILCLAFIFLSACEQVDNHSAKTTSVVIKEGTNMSVSVSPNQKMVVFDLLGQLWLMPANGGQPRPITDKYGNARQPQWSPDGSLIAFQAYWEGNWHIYTIQPDGSQLIRITQGAYDFREPSWGENGKTIFYSGDPSGNYDIWAFDMATKSHQNITDQPFNQYAPTYHPQQGLTYLDDTPDASGIVRMVNGEPDLMYPSVLELNTPSWNTDASLLSFLEGGKLRFINTSTTEKASDMLLPEGEDIFPFPLSWLDKENFLYTADGKIKKGSIHNIEREEIPFQIELKLDRPDYIPKSRSFAPATNLPIKGLYMPRLAPDGEALAIIMLKDLWLRKPDGSLLPVTNDPFIEMSPSWSPDQKKLAYLSDRSGQFGIYIYDLEQGTDEFLSEVQGSVPGIAWSPDGSKIAYSSSYGPRLGRLFYVSIADKKSTAVSGMISSSVGAPTWSPDGQLLAISTLQPFSTRFREGVNAVLYFSLTGEPTKRLGGLPHFSLGFRTYNGPEWSPDGKHLAVISSSRLWLIPVDSKGNLAGDPIQLTQELADAPSWSADGQYILYIATDRLKKINIETKEVQEVPINMTRDRVAPSGKKIVRAGNLFDGVRKTWLTNQDILIESNRIVDILPASAKNESWADEIIDASDQYVIPGLLDGHNHQGSVEGEILERTWLAWGVTGSRDAASDPYEALNRREAQEAGEVVGPRIFFTGSPFDGSRIYYAGANALQDAQQIELELERARKLDYDLIKTYVRLADSLQERIILAAHEMGLPVASHELFPAVSYGMDGMEHITGTSRRGYSPKMTAQNKAYQDVIALIAKSGMSFTPTTGIYVSYNYMLAQDTTLLDDPKVKALMSEFYQQSARQGIAQVRENSDVWQQDFTNAMKMVRDVYEEGGWIVAGTDSPIIPFGFGLHLELQAYTAAGMDPFDVLKSATIQVARALHVDNELGSIEKGKLADLLILDANPTEDMKNLMQTNCVMVNGSLYSVADLMKTSFPSGK